MWIVFIVFSLSLQMSSLTLILFLSKTHRCCLTAQMGRFSLTPSDASDLAGLEGAVGLLCSVDLDSKRPRVALTLLVIPALSSCVGEASSELSVKSLNEVQLKQPSELPRLLHSSQLNLSVSLARHALELWRQVTGEALS